MKKPVKGAVLAAMTLAMTTGFTIPSSSETITNSRREEVISEMMNDPDFKSMYNGNNRSAMERIVNDMLIRETDIVAPQTSSGPRAITQFR